MLHQTQAKAFNCQRFSLNFKNNTPFCFSVGPDWQAASLQYNTEGKKIGHSSIFQLQAVTHVKAELCTAWWISPANVCTYGNDAHLLLTLEYNHQVCCLLMPKMWAFWDACQTVCHIHVCLYSPYTYRLWSLHCWSCVFLMEYCEFLHLISDTNTNRTNRTRSIITVSIHRWLDNATHIMGSRIYDGSGYWC